MAGINIRQFSKRKVGAILAGAAVFAVVSASAATLGGLQTNHLGANSNEVIAPVTKGVGISWTTKYNETAKAYVVDGVTLTALGQGESIPKDAEVKVTLADKAGVALGEYVSTNGGSTWTTAPAPGSVKAHDVKRASVVINGGAVQAEVTGTD